MSIEAIGTKAEGGGTQQILSTATYISGLAPLTFMSGFAEIDLEGRQHGGFPCAYLSFTVPLCLTPVRSFSFAAPNRSFLR